MLGKNPTIVIEIKKRGRRRMSSKKEKPLHVFCIFPSCVENLLQKSNQVGAYAGQDFGGILVVRFMRGLPLLLFLEC